MNEAKDRGVGPHGDDRASEADANIANVLWSGAVRFGDRPAFAEVAVDNRVEHSVTYEQARTRVARLAGGLFASGLKPGDRVAFLMRNSQSYADSFLAVAAAGLVSVPLNIRLLGFDYGQMLSDSGARMLIADDDLLSLVPESTRSDIEIVVSLDGEPALDLIADRGRALDAPVPRRPVDPASLMYTSGTTGPPKAVVLSHESWRSVSRLAVEVLGMSGGETTLHVAPLTHGAGFLVLPTLSLGGLNLLSRDFVPKTAVTTLSDHGVTGAFMVPSMIRMLLDAAPAGWVAPASLRRIYYAGSPIDPGLLRDAMAALDGKLVQSFAQMESPMFLTYLDASDHEKAMTGGTSGVLVASAGRVAPGVALRIVGDGDQTLSVGSIGQVVARAPQVMSGYWRRPEATSTALRNGWLYTGDLGYVDEAGYLFLAGRMKDMIVTGGSNVYAREVEEALLTLSYVTDAAVIGTPHRVWGEAVTAVLVGEGIERDSAEVIADCRPLLAGYRLPKRVAWVDALPRNAYGKVLKGVLREQLHNEFT